MNTLRYSLFWLKFPSTAHMNIFIFFKSMLESRKVFDYIIKDRYFWMALQKYVEPKNRYARCHI